MGELTCDSARAWEVDKQCNFTLCKAKSCYISLLLHQPSHHAGAAAGCLEKGGRGKKKKEKERNGHLVALTNCYSKHRTPDPAVNELGRSFPTGFTAGKVSGPGTACCRETAGPSPAAILPEKLWFMRFPSPATRQRLCKRLFEKDRQQHLKGCGQNFLLAQCFLSDGKCSA